MREMGGTRLCAAFVALEMLMTGVFAGTASAGVLDRIGQDKAIRIAYREDAPPFSYKDKIGEPVGFKITAAVEYLGKQKGHWARRNRHARQAARFQDLGR